VLAAVLFLLALGMHIISFLEPTSLLPSGQVVSLTTMMIISGVMLSASIIVWFAGIFMTDLRGPQSIPWGGGPNSLAGLIILFQLVARSPLWLNLVLFVFLIYLIAASFLIRVGSDELTTRLQLFGALCSALNLHTLLLLGAAPRRVR
jgi:hypothetical protein